MSQLASLDNSDVLYDSMVKSCKQYDMDDSVQLYLLGFKIRDKKVADTRSVIMPAIKYAQKKMVEFASKTKNTLDVGPCDGIIGKMTIAAAKKYITIVKDMRIAVGVNDDNPVIMPITPTFNETTNTYNSTLSTGLHLFENFKFNKDICIDSHISNGKRVQLVKRDISKVTMLVIHETVTNSTEDTVDILRHRGFSTHFCIDVQENGNAVISQCMLINRVAWHINSKYNGCSIGIDIVNPYYPKSVNKFSKFKNNKVIKTKFAHMGKYVTPFDLQITALFILINALGTLLKKDFIGNIREKNMGGGWDFVANGALDGISKEGIVSHWSLGGHADGLLPLHQVWRLRQGVDIAWDVIP